MNREAYNRIAGQWDRARSGFFGRERDYLEILLDGLAIPSPILDLGCGSGRPMAEYALARGHLITGVDQAVQLIAIARARLPQATWIEARLEELDLAQHYAAIICWDALFHIERAWHEVLLSRMAHALLPGGRMMLTVGGSSHPAFTDTMFGETFFYDSHPPDRVLEIVKELGLAILIEEFMNPPTGGREKGRFALVAQRR